MEKKDEAVGFWEKHSAPIWGAGLILFLLVKHNPNGIASLIWAVAFIVCLCTGGYYLLVRNDTRQTIMLTFASMFCLLVATAERCSGVTQFIACMAGISLYCIGCMFVRVFDVKHAENEEIRVEKKQELKDTLSCFITLGALAGFIYLLTFLL